MTRIQLSRDLVDQGYTDAELNRLQRGGELRRIPPRRLQRQSQRAWVLVTTLARTILDLACTTKPIRSVPIGDAALARGLDPAEFVETLARAGRRRGIGTARRSIAMLDARSESVGELTSRVLFVEHGLPPPEPQYDVFDGAGVHVPRADFGWPALRTLGEFDGKIKYGRGFDPKRSPEQLLFDEKVREDRLRASGWQIVGWIWADFYRPAELCARLDAAFTRGRRAA